MRPPVQPRFAVGPAGTGAPMSEQTGDDSAIKDPEDWVTGDEPATGAQLSYLETLARETGETLPEQLTKAQASELIDELQPRSGRISPADAD